MVLDKKNLYRLPWSTNESPIGWFEVTDVCNIHCRGCYRISRTGHKPLQQLKEEVLFLKKWRNCNSISLAGGESILHPNIIDLISFINDNKMKSIIITNGSGLTEKNLTEMKAAGLTGVSFHIDSTQERPEFQGKEDISETELDNLRLKHAKIVAKVGGLTTNFGITADHKNFREIPKFVQWAINNSKIINSLTFITFRGLPVGDGLEYYAHGEKIDIKPDSLGYSISAEKRDKIDITTQDIYKIIKEHFQEYCASSYLGGTVDHTSFKWLLGNIILNSKLKMFGSFGKKTMEIIQTFYHLINETYVIHLKKQRFGKKIFLMALFDKSMRKALLNFVKYVLINPIRFFYPINILNIGIVQAPDLLPDGTHDMCESCPDMCVYDGKLVHSCRLDEYIQYGTLLHVHMTNQKSKTVNSTI
jgi:MoaA/NifB/PqqE/SkfB family radical SAM enzyme